MHVVQSPFSVANLRQNINRIPEKNQESAERCYQEN